MRLTLRQHPDCRSTAAERIEVTLARPHAGALELRYVVTGTIANLVVPAPDAPTRADGLWQDTCFELFVRAQQGGAYYEFNFSPSTQWAAYRFNGYRDGRSQLQMRAPAIEVSSSDERYEMNVSLDLPRDVSWRCGLTAVIEDASGERTYWALAHPPGKPDFHHADAFARDLPATGTT